MLQPRLKYGCTWRLCQVLKTLIGLDLNFLIGSVLVAGWAMHSWNPNCPPCKAPPLKTSCQQHYLCTTHWVSSSLWEWWWKMHLSFILGLCSCILFSIQALTGRVGGRFFLPCQLVSSGVSTSERLCPTGPPLPCLLLIRAQLKPWSLRTTSTNSLIMTCNTDTSRQSWCVCRNSILVQADCWPFATLLEIWALYNLNDKSLVLPTWVFSAA